MSVRFSTPKENRIGGLQITRVVGEKIFILHESGEVLVIQLIALISGNQAKIAIKASNKFKIHRDFNEVD